MLKQASMTLVFSAFTVTVFADPKNKGNFARNELPLLLNIVLFMKITCQTLFLSSILLFFLSATALSQERISTYGEPGAFSKIDRDYRKGDLTLNQKVLYKFYAKNNSSNLPPSYRTEGQEPIKCGTPALSDLHQHRSELSASSVNKIQSLNKSPTIQATKSYRSSSGRFTIYYETTGTHAVPPGDSDKDGVPDYVEEVAFSADSTYRHQVQRLGYTNPIPSGTTYDIEILNLQSYYGETYISSSTTGIRIENDFSENFPPNDHPEGDQIGAIYATLAHEFKHAVQYAANQWRGETGDWLEMDATLMEEIVYDNVNDYYNYLTNDASIFSNPEQSFYPGSYYHITWALYFHQKYGAQFWVNVWNIIKNNPSITMVDAMTLQLGSSNKFNEAYIESQLWHYASGPGNASPNFGFEESAAYPAPPIDTEKTFYNKNFTIPRTSPEPAPANFAAKYFNVPLPESPAGAIQVEVTSQGVNHGVGLIAYYSDGRVEGSPISLANRKSTFKKSNLSWTHIERLGLILTNSATPPSGNDAPINVGIGTSDFSSTLSQNYPNPFNPETQIRFTLDKAGHVELKVYNSAGRLVRTLVDRELRAGLHEPTFDGSNLASGIYFYRLVTGHQTFVKKMTLIK